MVLIVLNEGYALIYTLVITAKAPRSWLITCVVEIRVVAYHHHLEAPKTDQDSRPYSRLFSGHPR